MFLGEMAATERGEEAVPLNLQQRECVDPHTRRKDVVPALDPSWCKDVQFLCYVPPPPPAETADSALWLEALELMDSDLHWLLRQPHQKFWCQVIYDSSLHKFLDSYLRYGPRPHEVTPLTSLRGREVLTSLHRRVFMTFLRMSTHKESANHFLLEDSFGDIIYNNFLFDITGLLDLCSLYHTSNQPLLTKMITNIFQKQPRYQDDLQSALNSVLKLLDQVSEESVDEGETEGEKREGSVRLEDAQRLPASVVSEMVLYVADITSSLRCFMETYPPSLSLAAECGLMERFVSFYEETVIPLQRQWLALRHDLEPESASYQKGRLRQTKADVVWLVHSMLRETFLSNSSRNVTKFLEIVSSIISESAFLREFQRHFSLVDCVRDVQTLHPTFDQTQFDYILSALGATASLSNTAVSLATAVMAGASPVHEDGCIHRVLELLPHLSRSFVLHCLKECDFDAEKVIHHVLEGTLPTHLRQYLSGDSSVGGDGEGGEGGEGVRDDDGVMEGGLLEDRVGVFDGDEFDVFRRKNIDLSQVHIGKRSVTTADTLHDREHLDTNRERYQSYQFETPSDEEGEYEYDQYQDEYDDTYDSHNVGAADSETAEDLFTVKRLNVKGLFKKQFDTPVEEEEEEEGEGEGEGAVKPPPLLPGQVTLIRRDHRQPESKAGGERGHSHPAGAHRVTRERHIKEKHKSRVANHSRKALADRKRGKGLGAPPKY